MIFDCSGIHTKEELMEVLQRQFHFPEYFGKNWDAVEECLQDFPMEESVEIVGKETLSESMKEEIEILEDILAKKK